MVADHQGGGYQGELKQERGQLRVSQRHQSMSASAAAFAESGHPGATEPAVCAGPAVRSRNQQGAPAGEERRASRSAVRGQFQSQRRWHGGVLIDEHRNTGGPRKKVPQQPEPL
jgi:hypothetical protein